MKVTGAELKAFYRDWSDDKFLGDHDWYHDDGMMECSEETGQPILDNATEYDFDDQIGVLCWQGRGSMPSHIMVNCVRVHVSEESGIDTDALIKAWRGDAVIVSVRIAPAELGLFRKACEDNGWSPIE